MISAVLAAVSVLLLLLLSVRRIIRDSRRKTHEARKAEFDGVISAIISQKISVTKDLFRDLRMRDVAPLTDVFLSYLRNISGPDADRMIEVIHVWDVETLFRQHMHRVRRGERIEMLTVLSYLKTPSSLEIIADALGSRDLYVQLTAIRCLARRRAVNLLPEVIIAVNHEGQQNKTLLADVLLRFGEEAVPYLEKLVSSAVNETVRAAALEALVFISPNSTTVDFDLCMLSPDDGTRAAAVTLAGVVACRDAPDPIAKGVRDPSALVRARVAIAISKAGRVDLMEALTELIGDPVWWVRYRAGKALMDMSSEGKALMRSFSMQNNLEGIMAREILAEGEGG